MRGPVGAAPDQWHLKGLSQGEIAGVVTGELVSQPPNPVGKQPRFVSGDGERKVILHCPLGVVRAELSDERESTQDREHLDVEQVWRMDLAGQRVEQIGVGFPAHQGLNHRRGIQHDHLRPASTAATISSVVGPCERSRARSLAAISSLVGRAAIRASSAPT